MNWSYADLQDTPLPVVEEIVRMMEAEAAADRERRRTQSQF
jgi:hypothetical protein